jgi:restriction system protein
MSMFTSRQNLTIILASWEAERKRASGVAIHSTMLNRGRIPPFMHPREITPEGIVSEEAVGAPQVQKEGELLLQAQILVLGDKTSEGHLVQAVAIPWASIIKEWDRDPEFIFRLTSRQLEELIAGAYKEEGCDDVVLTPHSADKGRDVIVTATYPGIGTVKFIDQAKRYALNHLVTADDVRALLGVLSRDHGVSKGIVTTTSGFAPGIYEELKDFLPTRMQLKGGDELLAWLKELSTDE